MTKIKNIYNQYKELICYLFWGALTTIVSWGSYAVCSLVISAAISEKVFLAVIISNIFSWICASFFAFVTNKIWVFHSKKWNKEIVVKEFIKFFSTRFVTGLFELVAVPLLIQLGLNQTLFGIEGMFSKIFVSIIVVILNYIFSKFFIFKKIEENKSSIGDENMFLDKRLDKIKRIGIGIISAFLGFAISVFIFADRSMEISNFIQFNEAVQANHIGSVFIMIAGFLLFYFAFRISSKRIWFFSSIAAFVFSLCEILGYNIVQWDALWRKDINRYSFLLELLCFIGIFALCCGVLVLLFSWLEKKTFAQNQEKVLKWFSYNKRSFFLIFIILLCVYLISYIRFAPGVCTWDCYYQIEQGLGFRQLTDENPFLHTLLMGSIIKLGVFLFGNIANGFYFYIFIQMTLVALSSSCIMIYMAKQKICWQLRGFAFAYFALHPVIATYSVTAWKDIWISYLLLLYTMFLYDAVAHTQDFFKNWKKLLLLSCIIFGVMSAKNTGLYIVLMTLPFLWIFAHKYYKQLIIITAACFGVFFIIRTVVMPVFNVQPGHIREKYSVPLQQIARTVKYHGDDLTEEQKETIDEILPYEDLAELYNPRLSDPVKGSLNEEVFSQNVGKYFNLWIQMGIQHPKTYVESFLANTYGYWYPETQYWQLSNSRYYDILFMYRDNGWTVYDENVNNYVVNEAAIENSEQYIEQYDSLRNLPGFSLFFSLAFYFWAAFLLFLICIFKKQYKLMIPFTVVFAVLVTCLISPVHAECRYAFYAILAFPFLLSFVLHTGNKEMKNS